MAALGLELGLRLDSLRLWLVKLLVRACLAAPGYALGSGMDSKLSVALLELFCALGFVVGGLVLGLCFVGLIGPRLMHHGGQGLEEIGAMLNGAIVGTLFGVLTAIGALLWASRPRRQRLATSALALAALTALFTGLVVQHFGS